MKTQGQEWKLQQSSNNDVPWIRSVTENNYRNVTIINWDKLCTYLFYMLKRQYTFNNNYNTFTRTHAIPDK